MIKNSFTIKDLENISGIKAHTIRIWEKRYNLLVPERTSTNIRFYSVEKLQKLLNIVLLNKGGLKVSKIAALTNEEIKLYSRELVFKNSLNHAAINALKLSMFQFDKMLFNATYNKLIAESSFRDVFKSVFIPFLNEIGILWQTETLTPAHEHFMSNLISHKIQLNIEKIQYNIKGSKKIYVLFLPENEVHDLGLMYINYELVLRGHHTIYLGQSLPIDYLSFFMEKNEEICFVTKLTTHPYNDVIEKYFKEIDETLAGSSHYFFAIGYKTQSVENSDFEASIFLYDTIENYLADLK